MRRSGGLRLLSGAPDALTHPTRGAPHFGELKLLVTRRSCPQVKYKRSVEGCFLSQIVFPEKIDQFRPLQHLKVEVYAAVEN